MIEFDQISGFLSDLGRFAQIWVPDLIFAQILVRSPIFLRFWSDLRIFDHFGLISVRSCCPGSDLGNPRADCCSGRLLGPARAPGIQIWFCFEFEWRFV